MKKLSPLLALLIMAGCATFAPTDPAVAEAPLQYVYEIPGLASAAIFSLAQLWIADTYNSAESVITFRDEATGTIKGTAVGSVRIPGDPFVRDFRYALSIACKDGKTRLEFSNVRGSDSFSGGQRVAGVDIKWQSNYDAVRQHLDGLAQEFQTFMVSDHGGDW